MEKSKHGMTGNKNAMIDDEPRDSYIQFRINRRVKSKYVKQAMRNNMKLTTWIIKALDRACEEFDSNRKEKLS